MFCKNCGRQIPDDAAFCPACGTKRSGGETFDDARSGRDIKNLPNYAKENDLHRSGNAVDTNRDKFSLSGNSGQKKFSLSDSGQKKFSLSGDSGQKKFSLSGRDDGGIVRISANREPAAPPREPTGFVNPLKDSGRTVFHDEPAGQEQSPPQNHAAAQNQAPARPQSAEQEPAEQEPAEQESAAQGSAEQRAEHVEAVVEDGPTPPEFGNGTGFVNPLKDSGKDIHWGSDGDRNESKDGKFSGDPSEIDSHMGFAIFVTLCCCLPTGIVAIIFASQVSKHIQNGDYEAAKKSADNAMMFCWISLGIGLLCNVGSSIFSTLSEVLQP